MAVPVSLQAVVDEMEMLDDEMHAFVNRQTGEIYGGTREQIAMAESDGDDDLLEWEVEIVHRLREIGRSSDWLELPHRSSHEDYRCMENFCLEHCEGRLQEELLSAISGRGAFGRFKEVIHRRSVQDAWYAYRREWLTKEARGWLEAHGLASAP